MLKNMLLLGALSVAAYIDYKEKKVYLWVMLLLGSIGIVLHLFYQTPSLWDMLAGAGIGVAVMLLAALTRECIGVGDGVVLFVSGIFLGFQKNLELFLTALFLSGCAALFLLVIRRKGRGYRIPFVPFLAAAYLIQLLCG